MSAVLIPMTLFFTWPERLDSALNLHEAANKFHSHISILRMLLCILSSYFFSLLERQIFILFKAARTQAENKANRSKQQLFHLFLGFLYLFYCYREECKYNYLTILVQYLIVNLDKRLNSRLPAQILTWSFQVAFLTYGYSFAYGKNTEYVVNWTMTQCVITLKLIQISTDISDGLKMARDGKKNSEVDVKKSSSSSSSPPPDRLEEIINQESFPNLLEFFSYSTYYNTVLVGPQMTLSHYRNYVDAVHIKKAGFINFRSETRKTGTKKFMLGIFMMAFFALFAGKYLDDNIWQSENSVFFTKYNYYQKVLFITVYGNLKMFRYVSTWSLVEGSLILAGMGTAYSKLNRKDENKTLHHNHCSNASFSGMVKSTLMSDYVEVFNINTNKWCFTYLFKRLAFLGNKNLSQILTLMFLAVWHGYFSGYFTCFMYEFIVLLAEKQMLKAGLFIKGYISAQNSTLKSKIIYFLRGILQKIFQVLLLSGYAVIDFSLLRFEHYWRVWKSVYFYGIVVCLVQYLLASLVIKVRDGKGGKKEKVE